MESIINNFSQGVQNNKDCNQFGIGFCVFGRNNKDVFFLNIIAQKMERLKKEIAKAIDKNSPYVGFAKSYKGRLILIIMVC
ncbi:hypothetical protein HRAG_00262 [Helicobacter bilis ATCC 43879]|uniref:Uncharacterized protein n=2 Tax=Helicobacter TaxID=209 RepID=C3XDW6_9HELI|nr:hypothetical protein HRAG_00262 [Helicobacter bilis ATCC 43879]